MILENQAKIKNYKCFGDNEQGFEKIFPLNIIIGKNNSGKSSLLEIISYLINPSQAFLKVGRNRIDSQVNVSQIITEDLVRHVFPSDKSGGGLPGNTHYDYGLQFVGKKIKYHLNPDKIEIYEWEDDPLTHTLYLARLQAAIKSPLINRPFIRITAERDITSEGNDATNKKILSNGRGATNLIRQIVTDSSQNLNLVRYDLLRAFNEIVSPDIEFKHITPRENSSHEWEVYFEDRYDSLIPLSRMGSGIKTILLVLLNLIVVPEIENYNKADIVFGFEELENNLHPSLQRRLFNFIIKYAKVNGCYFFITTHSSIIIDLFSTNVESQVLHIKNIGDSSEVKTLTNLNDGRNILRDLDFKASDLLMSNGIIWVEGPSDVIYLGLLLELLNRSQNYNRGVLNYSIQSLATAIWKYAGFTDFDWSEINDEIENRIISLQNINSNHLLIIDRDDNYEDKSPSQWNTFKNGTGRNKARLIFESLKFAGYTEGELSNNYGDSKANTLLFWITEGTFESYLEHFISTKGKNQFSKYFTRKKERGYFEKKRDGKNHSISKVELAIEIAKFIYDNQLSIDDLAPINSSLRTKLEKLKKTIDLWN